MTKRFLFGLLTAAVLMISLPACGGPRVLGARALLPLQGNDTSRVWIYMDTNDESRNGVYRCVDEGGQVQCIKARLQ